jgi:Fe-S-cluster-containing dehydrogenase component
VDKDPKHPDPASRAGRRLQSLHKFSGAYAGAPREFPHGAADPPSLPLDGISRRRFLSLLSASAALACGTSCSRIERGDIVPYTRKPEEIIPGIANYYASTYQEGLVSHGVLVKTREGRPIHIEGNDEHTTFRGRAGLRAMGDLLSLYDPDRLRGPVEDGISTAWQAVEDQIFQALSDMRSTGKPLLLITDAVVSPTRRALIEDCKKALLMRHVVWEPAACQAELSAAKALYGEVVLPWIRLDRAEVILSLQADFLGVDGAAPALIRDFAARRSVSSPGDPMNRLWVMEGCMTVTGANADQRLPVSPSKTAALAFALARLLSETHGLRLPSGMDSGSLGPFDPDQTAQAAGVEPSRLRALAEDLRSAGRSGVVLAGPALPQEAHIACRLLNTMLESESLVSDPALSSNGATIATGSQLRDILQEASQGAYGAAIFWGANPGYSFPDASLWETAVAGIPVTIRIGLFEDETALDCRWRLPENHWLESWGDFESSGGMLSLRQPAIGTIHDTRQGEGILLALLRRMGAEAPPTYHEYLMARWEREIYPAGGPVSFEAFWNAALHDGVLKGTPDSRAVPELQIEGIAESLRAAEKSLSAASGDAFELILLPSTAVYDGRYANNGWLQELPDPVTKATWGNPLLVSPFDAARLGFKDEDLATVSAGGQSLQIPVLVQQGQPAGVLSLALGYGRGTGSVAAGIGVNAYPLMDVASASPHLRPGARLAHAAGRRPVPRTQEHHRMEGRDLVRSWTRGDYARKLEEKGHGTEAEHASLIPVPDFVEHKWGMVIDLSACVGCSACVIACQSENNIPVVGPEQVLTSREMHWIRIDRYYEGDSANPLVVHQPVLCQHCDDAPCEIVCPVNATTHSPDGLNQMVYNRCVGTRYCSNNCPFKVRRFNFFDYTAMKKPPETLVFNPEVTVRPRGVMEKCSFCIQRIQDVRQRANVEKRKVRDGEIIPACAAACPSNAIIFGDLMDPWSRVSLLGESNRGYHLLEELGVRPSITYLADISNPTTGKGNP